MTAYTTLDTNWMGRPKSIASVLVQNGGVKALIDPGPASTIETLRAELQRHGLSVRDLDALLVTHIHLDHSAAAGLLVRENPRLKIYVHEFGATHMADPSKLLASAGRLYGGEMERLYGAVLPVPKENLLPLVGGEKISVGDRQLSVLYTPGHASHHVTFWDASEGIAFVGDVGGISIEGDEFPLPVTPPPDIDLELWNKSLDAVLALQPQKLFLTHFGYAHDPATHIAQYRERLMEWGELAKKLLVSGKPEEEASKEFVEAVAGEIKRAKKESSAEHYIFNGGLYLSWLGLARHFKKKAQAASNT